MKYRTMKYIQNRDGDIVEVADDYVLQEGEAEYIIPPEESPAEEIPIVEIPSDETPPEESPHGEPIPGKPTPAPP